MSRLPAHVLVGGLIRAAEAKGGFATVLAKGDRDAGAIWLVCLHRGQNPLLLERFTDPDGRSAWRLSGPQGSEGPAAQEAYLARRRAADPDLWIVELDIADAERFAVEWLAAT